MSNYDSLSSLAKVLGDTLRRLRAVLGEQPWNMVLHTAPATEPTKTKEEVLDQVGKDSRVNAEEYLRDSIAPSGDRAATRFSVLDGAGKPGL